MSVLRKTSSVRVSLLVAPRSHNAFDLGMRGIATIVDMPIAWVNDRRWIRPPSRRYDPRIDDEPPLTLDERPPLTFDEPDTTTIATH